MLRANDGNRGADTFGSWSWREVVGRVGNRQEAAGVEGEGGDGEERYEEQASGEDDETWPQAGLHPARQPGMMLVGHLGFSCVTAWEKSRDRSVGEKAAEFWNTVHRKTCISCWLQPG